MVTPTHLLDTNTWIYVLKGNPGQLVARLGTVDPDSVAFCSIVKAELVHGAYRYGNREKRLTLLQTLFNRHASFPFDDQAAAVYGRIRYALETKGQVIGPMDLLIAAIALANNLILVTHNTDEFARVDGLQMEDWTV
ncbi:MAG: type II toxin-antitoxin system VapC family toxin [Caldilineaceae bacterium]